MPWYVSLALETPVAPADQATSSITSLVLGYGPIGVAVLALAWLMFRGWRLASPAQETAARVTARDEARADVIGERDRANARADKAEEQRDEALQIIQTQVVPMLTSLTDTTKVLIPLLQDAIRSQEGRRDGGYR